MAFVRSSFLVGGIAAESEENVVLTDVETNALQESGGHVTGLSQQQSDGAQFSSHVTCLGYRQWRYTCNTYIRMASSSGNTLVIINVVPRWALDKLAWRALVEPASWMLAIIPLTLPYLWGGCLLGRHPALTPQHGPSAHPRQTSRLTEPLWSFGKPQKVKSPSISFRRSIKALHWAIRCTVVSSSSWQRGQPESCRIPIIDRCQLRSVPNSVQTRRAGVPVCPWTSAGLYLADALQPVAGLPRQLSLAIPPCWCTSVSMDWRRPIPAWRSTASRWTSWSTQPGHPSVLMYQCVHGLAPAYMADALYSLSLDFLVDNACVHHRPRFGTGCTTDMAFHDRRPSVSRRCGKNLEQSATRSDVFTVSANISD